ncbi:DUF58 domain-containing protein [Paenibacillus sp. JCM 10914]|uniref:DUF58 domain-containing protein n=1 Tax=Paenibacillus sp. JCM 10914 TaxID=1236974 RepID=UPI0003CC5E25|nr:DUF58 domain-containing protein [Paenibacillus sp. JCM 10914]GAE04952.1 excinuclease ABC [Paenibacillus sp. JCM 10914]
MGAYWILIIAAIMVLIQGKLFRSFSFKKLSYRRAFKVNACYEGDAVELVETIENRKAFPVPWLRVESQFRTGLVFDSQLNLDISEGQFNQNHKSFFSLLPWTKIVRRHRIKAGRRGVYKLGTVSMTTGDLLGMESMVKSHTLAGGIVVYPMPIDVSDMELPVQTWMGDLLVKRWIMEDPFYISGVREYRDGDPLKDIQWKATARTGQLQVHRRDTTADSRLMIYLNIEDHEQMWSKVTKPEPIEYGIRQSAGIAAHLLSQGMEVGFGSNGMLGEESSEDAFIPIAGGRSQQDLILEMLARLELIRRLSFHDYLGQELHRHREIRDILILTTYVSPRLEQMLQQFRDLGHTIQIVYLESHSVPSSAKEVTA